MSFTVLKGFVAKAPLDSVSQQLTKVIEWTAEDAGPMLAIKTKEATDFLKEVKEDIDKKKCSKPLLRLGTDSGHLVMRVEGDPKYEKSVIVAKGYVDHKAKNAKALVVNADAGDSTIDDAADDMARIKGTKAKTAEEVNVNAKGNKTPIVLLAHGSPTSSLPGTVHATEFANRTPEQIIKFLVDDKKLDKGFSSVIYLDGCYTAAGPKKGRDAAELTNFAGKVYAGLVKAGYKYLQVKGNLGRAATLDDGTENVLDAQEEARHKARQAELSDAYDALSAKSEDIKKRVDKLEKVATALVARHAGNADALKADVGIKLVREEVDKLEVERTAAGKKLAEMAKEYQDLKKDMAPGGKFRIDNLVGVFGPEKLASKPWYKKLFG